MKIDKEKVINILVEDDIQNAQDNFSDFQGYFESILREGFIGYNKQTAKELEEELNERQDNVVYKVYERKNKKS